MCPSHICFHTYICIRKHDWFLLVFKLDINGALLYESLATFFFFFNATSVSEVAPHGSTEL